jgi:methylmalonyl-CoA/ethylmalonyl-CoA epimerase
MTAIRPHLAKRIDHVGVAVRDIDKALAFYVDVLGLTVSVDVALADGSTRLAYLETGDTTLQLVQPLRPGPLTEFLDTHGEGLHHVCFAVDNVIGALRSMPDGEPEDGVYVGGRGCRVSFVKAQPSGVLIELTELQPIMPTTQRDGEDAVHSVSPLA